MKNGFTVFELLLVVLIIGFLVLILIGMGTCAIQRKRDCDTTCGREKASVETNHRGSDKCWCTDSNGVLQLRKVY